MLTTSFSATPAHTTPNSASATSDSNTNSSSSSTSSSTSKSAGISTVALAIICVSIPTVIFSVISLGLWWYVDLNQSSLVSFLSDYISLPIAISAPYHMYTYT